MIRPTVPLSLLAWLSETFTRRGLAFVRFAYVICPPALLVQKTCSTSARRMVTAKSPVSRTKNRARYSNLLCLGAGARRQKPGDPLTSAVGTP